MAHRERVTFGTLFQSNGLSLKQGKESAHSFHVKQINCIETKLMKVTQDMVALENRTTMTDLGKGRRRGGGGMQPPFFLLFLKRFCSQQHQSI